MTRMLASSAERNGFSDRLTICRALIGTGTQWQAEASADPIFASAPFCGESELIERYKLDRIDLLKCDIEGSEFGFIGPDSKLLDRADRVAIEIHSWGGDVHKFLDELRSRGFTILREDWDRGSCTAIAVRADLEEPKAMADAASTRR